MCSVLIVQIQCSIKTKVSFLGQSYHKVTQCRLFHLTFFRDSGLGSWERRPKLDASAEVGCCAFLWVVTRNLHLAKQIDFQAFQVYSTLLGGTVRLVKVRLSAPRLKSVIRYFCDRGDRTC